MIHNIECLIEPSHAFEIDAAVKQPRTVKAAAQDWPVQPVFPVV